MCKELHMVFLLSLIQGVEIQAFRYYSTSSGRKRTGEKYGGYDIEQVRTGFVIIRGQRRGSGNYRKRVPTNGCMKQ